MLCWDTICYAVQDCPILTFESVEKQQRQKLTTAAGNQEYKVRKVGSSPCPVYWCVNSDWFNFQRESRCYLCSIGTDMLKKYYNGILTESTILAIFFDRNSTAFLLLFRSKYFINETEKIIN